MLLKKKRNTGIELLRIVSMIMIGVLHILGHGNILFSEELSQGSYKTVWFMEIACFCAVNCYALISGYVGITAVFRYTRLVTTHLRVIFYSVVITLIFAISMPGIVGKEQIRAALFPVINQSYWYYTAYFALFLLIPYLNYLAQGLSREQYRTLIIVVITLFSVLPTISGTDIFRLHDGYSVFWLIVMYLLGAYIKKYEDSFLKHSYVAFILYVICVLVTWSNKLVGGGRVAA